MRGAARVRVCARRAAFRRHSARERERLRLPVARNHSRRPPAASTMSAEKARAALKDSVYINGAWVKPAGTFDVVSGATGELIAACPLAVEEHADAAAKAAAAAFKTWSKVPAAERAVWLKCVRAPRARMRRARARAAACMRRARAPLTRVPRPVPPRACHAASSLMNWRSAKKMWRRECARLRARRPRASAALYLPSTTRPRAHANPPTPQPPPPHPAAWRR